MLTAFSCIAALLREEGGSLSFRGGAVRVEPGAILSAVRKFTYFAVNSAGS
jgi:hypothetical protein